MLILKPNCELCDKDLPADASDACICSYECTFCARCVSEVLYNVCPNCGGGFCPRPIRPTTAHRPRVSLVDQPPSSARVNSNYTDAEIQDFANRIKHLEPHKR